MLIEILNKLRVLPIIEELLVHYSGFSLLSLLLSRNYSIPYIPTLLLTTIGKKSGLRRTVPLFFFRDGDSYFVIGSRGHYFWFLISILIQVALVQVKSQDLLSFVQKMDSILMT